MDEGVNMNMEVGLITKRSNEVEMIRSMEELMNFMHQHELVEGDYGAHFTTYEVNKFSFHSCLLPYNLNK